MPAPRFSRNARRTWRPGTIYLYVLITSALVSVIGLAALIGVRVQRKAATIQSDGAQARTGARSAIDLGLLWLWSDPAWRSGRSAPWGDAIELGDTTLTVTAIDPVDDDLRNNDTDPIYLVGTATRGEASHTMAVGVMPTSGLGALEVSMLANADLHLQDGTVTSDQIIGSNANVTSQNVSNVYADVEAVGTATDAIFHAQVDTGVAAREVPDPAAVVSYYQGAGTWLTIDSNPNLLDNSGFETAVSPWVGTSVAGVDLERRSDGAPAGSWYLAVKNRESSNEAVQQDLARLPAAGDQLDLTLHVQVTFNDKLYAALEVGYEGGGTDTVEVRSGSISKDAWTAQSLTIDVPSGGVIASARLTLRPNNMSNEFHIDDVVLTRVIDPGITIRDSLLSPKVNDFGAASTDGIFVIDCAGKDITIENCRIVGTLLVLNPGNGSIIQGSVAWEPAIPNYPALIVDGDIDFVTVASPLSEATIGVNLNPIKVPYPFTGDETDADTDDVFASKISGIVYCTGKIKFKGASAVQGVVIAHDELWIQDGDVTISYSNIHANDPPPAFDTSVRDVEIIAGTWIPVVR